MRAFEKEGTLKKFEENSEGAKPKPLRYKPINRWFPTESSFSRDTNADSADGSLPADHARCNNFLSVSVRYLNIPVPYHRDHQPVRCRLCCGDTPVRNSGFDFEIEQDFMVVSLCLITDSPDKRYRIGRAWGTYGSVHYMWPNITRTRTITSTSPMPPVGP